MQATTNQTVNDFVGLVMWIGEYVLGKTNHARVQPGTLQMADDPTTVFGWFERFSLIKDWTQYAGLTTPMFWSWVALSWSYIFDPN